MKATELLTKQHDDVKLLFDCLIDADAGERRALFESVAKMLAAHDAIERRIFYPAIQVEMGMTPILGESIVEHGIVEFMLFRTDLALKGDEFPHEFTVLCDSVLHHVEEEEDELFPQIEQALDARRLLELGEAMEYLFNEELKKDFRVVVHSQLQQVLKGGMKTEQKPTRVTSNGSPRRTNAGQSGTASRASRS
jgi:hemerythrin superfamily protein